jgi:hypothetical protein
LDIHTFRHACKLNRRCFIFIPQFPLCQNAERYLFRCEISRVRARLFKKHTGEISFSPFECRRDRLGQCVPPPGCVRISAHVSIIFRRNRLGVNPLDPHDTFGAGVNFSANTNRRAFYCDCVSTDCSSDNRICFVPSAYAQEVRQGEVDNQLSSLN